MLIIKINAGVKKYVYMYIHMFIVAMTFNLDIMCNNINVRRGKKR